MAARPTVMLTQTTAAVSYVALMAAWITLSYLNVIISAVNLRLTVASSHSYKLTRSMPAVQNSYCLKHSAPHWPNPTVVNFVILAATARQR